MKKSRAKKIATWIIVPLMASIFILDIITVVLSNKYADSFTVEKETFTLENGDDRIHFLNTANSDSILVESNGRFFLVDAGEGNDNPRRKTEYKGYEQEVIDYIKKIAVVDGKVMLDFIIATHCHYDHIGSFEALINDTDINIGKAYFKKFNEKVAKNYEVGSWKIDSTYNAVISALESRGVELISDLPTESFMFGDFNVKFYNTVTPEEVYGNGENASSVGIKLTRNGKSAFLAADITASTGLEDLLAEEIGDVDILKIGHHGYYGSSSISFLDVLKPEIAVVTNQLGKIYPNVKWNLTMHAKVPVYATYDNNGIIATFTDSGDIILSNNIH